MGAFHIHHCEDFLIDEPLATDKRLLAVMDGCSMGTESVFASMLIGKILRKIAKEIFYQEFVTGKCPSLAELLRVVTKKLMAQTVDIKNQFKENLFKQNEIKFNEN